MAWEDLGDALQRVRERPLYPDPNECHGRLYQNLANLIKYGSDGVNPYTSPQSNPVYPGLNPNLRVYIEWSNEIWNWAFTQGPEGVQLARDAVQQNTPNGQIINFDGNAPNGNYQRWSALRTVETSNIFRSVWGDAAMGNTIRVLLEYQYDDGQGTATGELNFIDNYFNNGDGKQHVAKPHPVSYYIWGGGGAAYYSGTNEQGIQTAIVPADPGLESPALPSGSVSVAPPGTAWSFTGNAGIVSDTTKVSPSSEPGSGHARDDALRSHPHSATRSPSEPATSRSIELGRWVAPGDICLTRCISFAPATRRRSPAS